MRALVIPSCSRTYSWHQRTVSIGVTLKELLHTMFCLEMMYEDWRFKGTNERSEDRNSLTRMDFSTFSCRLTCRYWYEGCDSNCVLMRSANEATWYFID